MAIELEKIKSWDGQSGTGADNRGVIDRNFEKVKTELEGNKAEIVQLAGNLKENKEKIPTIESDNSLYSTDIIQPVPDSTTLNTILDLKTGKGINGDGRIIAYNVEPNQKIRINIRYLGSGSAAYSLFDVDGNNISIGSFINNSENEYFYIDTKINGNKLWVVFSNALYLPKVEIMSHVNIKDIINENLNLINTLKWRNLSYVLKGKDSNTTVPSAHEVLSLKGTGSNSLENRFLCPYAPLPINTSVLRVHFYMIKKGAVDFGIIRNNSIVETVLGDIYDAGWNSKELNYTFLNGDYIGIQPKALYTLGLAANDYGYGYNSFNPTTNTISLSTGHIAMLYIEFAADTVLGELTPGELIPNGNYVTSECIYIDNLDIENIFLHTNSSCHSIILWDINKKYIAGVGAASDIIIEYDSIKELTTLYPATKYVTFTIDPYRTNNVIIGHVSNNKLLNTMNDLYHNHSIEELNLIKEYFRKFNNTFTQHEIVNRTDYLSLTKYKFDKIYIEGNASAWVISYWDKNKNFISGIEVSTTDEIVTTEMFIANMPENAEFVIFSINVQKINIVNYSEKRFVSIGDVPEPFYENVYSNRIPLFSNGSYENINGGVKIPINSTNNGASYYFNADFNKDFKFSFNFEVENRQDSTSTVELIIQLEGTTLKFTRNKFTIGLFEGTGFKTSAPFESRIGISRKENVITITLADTQFTYFSELFDMYFNIAYSATPNNLFLIDAVNGFHPISFATYGLQYPHIGMAVKGDYCILAYYNTARQLTVSRINLITKDVLTKTVTSVVTALDSHNYLDIGIGSDNSLHIAGNCHDTPLNYCFSPNYLTDLELLTVSDKIISASATYPDFCVGNDLFFSFREGGSGNSTNIAYKYDSIGKIFNRTTSLPFADGTGGKGGTAYFGKWIYNEADGYFYNAWCWRTTPDVATNNQVNLIKTQNFADFFGYGGESLALPISRDINPTYCIDNVPENSGLINQWFIISFIVRDSCHVWYMKNDENGNNNIYLVYPSNGSYATIKVTNFHFKWAVYGTGGIDTSVINVIAEEIDDFIVLHINHRFEGKYSYYIDKDYSVETRDYELIEMISSPDRRKGFRSENGINVLHDTERTYYGTYTPLRDGKISII